jgi:hypothetical protein
MIKHDGSLSSGGELICGNKLTVTNPDRQCQISPKLHTATVFYRDTSLSAVAAASSLSWRLWAWLVAAVELHHHQSSKKLG